MSSPSVSVTIVTFNSKNYLDACLRSVFAQRYPRLEVVVIDNASADRTDEVLAKYSDRIKLFRNDRNVGFAAAQNEAIAACTGEWILVLNPDVVLAPGFIDNLVEA